VTEWTQVKIGRQKSCLAVVALLVVLAVILSVALAVALFVAASVALHVNLPVVLLVLQSDYLMPDSALYLLPHLP